MEHKPQTKNSASSKVSVNLWPVILSGVMTGMSFNFSWLSWLAWIGLVPFINFLAKEPRLGRNILGSFLFGIAFYTTALFWVGNISKLSWVGPVGYLGLVAVVLYFSLYIIVFGIISRPFINKSRLMMTIPCLWISIEFLKENIWVGCGWGNLAYSQYLNSWLIQPIDLLGGKFISFLIVMVNIVVWELVFNRKNIIPKVIMVCGLLSMVCLYSVWRLDTFKPSGSVKVSIIQPNVAEQEKYQSSSTIILDRLKNFAAISDKDSLVVFPEAVWPIAGKQSEISAYSDFSNQVYRDVVLGTAFIDEGGYYNAAVFSGKEGEIFGVYKKMHLVPFGEYIPMRKMLSFISVINQLGDMNQGKEYKVFSWRDKRFAVLICFEDLYSNQVSLLSRQSDFLVNITNDEWFRGEPEASQHLAILTFRAIENRISIVRCANTGVSGWVSFKGDIHRLQKDGREDFVEGVWNENIPVTHERSLFSRLGESFFVLICAFWLIFSVFKLK